MAKHSEQERLRRPFPVAFLIAAAVAVMSVGCGEDNGTPAVALRFGQIGQIRVSLVAPLAFGEGELQQVLTWHSNGTWRLFESISYRGLPGDETERSEAGDPGAYASLITQLNETPGVELFTEELFPDLPEPCPFGDTEVSVTIRDEIKDREVTWVRCAKGSLATLETADAGPDPQAVRVIQAAILVREFTQPEFVSAYLGSVPFGTLDRSEDSGAELLGPKEFVGRPAGSPATPPGWFQFWRTHTGQPLSQPPPVDWANEMVLVAAVGERSEAGDSVEVRRVLQTGEGTQVTLFERVPGDFCSPAARNHYPVHIVVAPRTALPVRFNEVVKERVSCGT